MKLRNGFVSNSSSSSFIVAFPKEPKSVQDVEDMMFDKDQNMIRHPYEDDVMYHKSVIADTIYNELSRKNKLPKLALIECVKHEGFEGAPKCDYGRMSEEMSEMRYHIQKAIVKKEGKKSKVYRTYKEKYEDECQIAATKFVNKFLSESPRQPAVYEFSFSDNDGTYECFLEHGDIFSKLKHVRFSHH